MVEKAPRARVIDGAAVSRRIRQSLKQRVARFVQEQGHAPCLATLLIGEDPASEIYVANKIKACKEAGIASFHRPLPADVAEAEILTLIDELNEDPHVSGILCQLPLPEHLDPVAITNRIRSDKDVDGLTIGSAGRLALGLPGLRPCTPLGITVLLEDQAAGLCGKHAVVVGSSNLVGKPMGQMLLAEKATVTQCHKYTTSLDEICRTADILVVAAGAPGLIKGDWIKPGAIVIDVGISRTDEGIVGDVCFDEAAKVAASITPVPGGVGPMTIACLLVNTVNAAESAAARERVLDSGS